MGKPELGAVPSSLKPIQHYLKTAAEHDNRDPVIAYWCRVLALQNGMELDKASKEALGVLLPLMDWLEAFKKENVEEEAVTNETVANAHIENYAMKLFLWADREDRAARFNKNVVKAFYTAGMLFDVLIVFGELTPEVAHHQKYAKWKAAYIHNCLKSGETPIPGPMNEEEDEEEADKGDQEENQPPPPQQQQPPQPQQPTYQQPPPVYQPPQPTHQAPPPAHQPVTPTQPYLPPVASGPVALNPQQTKQAQKYCKFAISALDYDDTNTAIMELQKALHLIQTGQDS